uniref:Regulation of nuclear pre-mRNA domain containing 2b n=1 Tax=Xiphophorus couchianus TaxID=32473 RepID=A0A3B5MNY3_9TELE
LFISFVADHSHRLNLFYLANDVIQNCKRKNAIVFRSAFSDVLPNAALLVKDGKVRKSVERIFSIWEERNVYPEEVIAQFKASLHKKDKEREKQREKEKEKQKEKETPSNNAALKSKIVAEFTPHFLIEQLSRHKQAAAEEQIREKQLETLRVDVLNTEAFKRLKDKAGGNNFAKDFEDGSLKLQEFVSFLEKELKTGPPLLEALGNADIFYEMQYKEVKIVANAYNAFANRVNSLKKKLDSLKASLSGPEDSPIPSPSEDAPSPTGSDSPFLDMEKLQNDNRDMEDMDMSDEEACAGAAQGELCRRCTILKLLCRSQGVVFFKVLQLNKLHTLLSLITAEYYYTVYVTSIFYFNHLKTGLSSLLQSVTNTSTAPSNRTSPDSSSVKTPITPTTPKTKPALGNSVKQDEPGRARDWEKERQLSPPPPPPPPPRTSAPSSSPPSLESKINSFLQGNPGFSLALGDASPDGVDGTPVRDEAAGTPTQDEIMDTPGGVPESLGSSGSHNLSPTAYRNDPWDAAVTPTGSSNNGDFLGSSSSRFGAGKRSGMKLNNEDIMRKQVSSSSAGDLKGRNSRALAERRLSAGSRKASTGSDDAGLGGKKDSGKERLADAKEGQYHRIETLVSPHTEGAPIQTLGYSNRPSAGERIKTVESIRLIGRGSRRGGGAGSRPGASMWYEEEEYLEGQPPSPQGGGEDMNPSILPPPFPPPPPHHIPHLHPPPSLPLPPQPPFPMPYHPENMQTPPPSMLQPHLHPSASFFASVPPIPRLPPPPSMHRLSPPPPHLSLPHSVMVGGILVPVDHSLPLPPSLRPKGAEHSRMGPRGRKVTPPPLMSSLLGDPPKLPRPGTVKEPLIPRHTPPLHRPGAPGVPPPLLGDSSLSKPPPSPPAAPHNPGSNPVPLLNLPTSRPPILATPMQQRPPMRGRSLSQDHPMGGFHGGKRAGPPFGGGPFHAQKRPYLPPRY